MFENNTELDFIGCEKFNQLITLINRNQIHTEQKNLDDDYYQDLESTLIGFNYEGENSLTQYLEEEFQDFEPDEIIKKIKQSLGISEDEDESNEISM